MSMEAASAAASVTRTASRARLRSMLNFVMTSASRLPVIVVAPTRAFSAEVGTGSAQKMRPTKNLQRFDANHMRRLGYGVQQGNPIQRATHGCLLRLVGGQHDRHRLAWGTGALEHGFERDFLIAQGRGDVGDDARLVDH